MPKSFSNKWKFKDFHRPSLVLAEGEEEAGEEEPEPEDLAVEAEKRPKGNVGYMRPVEHLEVAVPPVAINYVAILNFLNILKYQSYERRATF